MTKYRALSEHKTLSISWSHYRDLLLERTHSGIARAKAVGKRFGRPSSLNEEQQLTVLARINAGISISAIAREFNTTRQTILRIKAGQK